MGFWGWFWLAVVVIVGFAILSAWANASKAKSQLTALTTLPDFTVSVVFKGMSGGAGIAIDAVRSQFAISDGPLDTKVFRFSDLVAVEVLRNGTSIHKTNRGSKAVGAAVGAVLLGPVGLIVGGLTGSKRSVSNVDKLSLKIFTNDLINPVHEVVFFNGPSAKPDSLVVQHASQELDAWHGRFQTILAMSAKTSVATEVQAVAAPV